MASWDDLTSYVRMRYEIMKQLDGELWFNLPTTGERTQIVALRRVVGEDDHPWVQITSPIGDLDEIDLGRMLTMAGDAVAGGAIAVGQLVLYRHSFPLDGTALAAFERPFRMVVEIADRLELELTGRDDH